MNEIEKILLPYLNKNLFEGELLAEKIHKRKIIRYTVIGSRVKSPPTLVHWHSFSVLQALSVRPGWLIFAWSGHSQADTRPC